jgi:hypothetical protein
VPLARMAVEKRSLRKISAGVYPYKRSHLVALRRTKISASDPASTWWPGER